MAKIGQIVEQLLPDGSGWDGDNTIKRCPVWPPDVFAVTALLAERAGIYTESSFAAGWDAAGFYFNGAYLERVTRLAAEWAESVLPPAEVQELWEALLGFGAVSVQSDQPVEQGWKTIVMTLLAIADEAANGIGFYPQTGETQWTVAALFVSDHAELLKHRDGDPPVKLSMPHLPMSLCRMVLPQDVCVQPKTMTPSVGCNLRSLSHNLALLPSRGSVATSWFCAYPAEEKVGHDNPFNVLLVPFPYTINGRNFVAGKDFSNAQNRFFSLDLDWMQKNGKPAPSADLVQFIEGLISAAEKDVGVVHAVILPEAALTEDLAKAVAEELARRKPLLELFVSGTVSHGEGARNSAYTSRFHEGERLKDWFQSKHHRWRLEKSQIQRYHLGHALDPNLNWWERINIANRTCVFTVVRPGASLAVLVCEDLARFDPVMPAINAVGPNLVIALLLDGPQLERRWPGRYATVLADDPGSSVLTLTSLGMIRRSVMPGARDEKQIALWKEPGGNARELQLGSGDHALVLALTINRQEQLAFDGRTDRNETRVFNLSAVRGVKVDRSKVPEWLILD